jgi:hypothetical protein
MEPYFKSLFTTDFFRSQLTLAKAVSSMQRSRKQTV